MRCFSLQGCGASSRKRRNCESRESREHLLSPPYPRLTEAAIPAILGTLDSAERSATGTITYASVEQSQAEQSRGAVSKVACNRDETAFI